MFIPILITVAMIANGPNESIITAPPAPVTLAAYDMIGESPAMPGYPVRASNTWWTGCDSWRHMTQGEHAGTYDPAWLQSLSWDELQSLHSDDHDGTLIWDSIVRPGSNRRNGELDLDRGVFNISANQDGYCPNGLCPVATTYVPTSFVARTAEPEPVSEYEPVAVWNAGASGGGSAGSSLQRNVVSSWTSTTWTTTTTTKSMGSTGSSQYRYSANAGSAGGNRFLSNILNRRANRVGGVFQRNGMFGLRAIRMRGGCN